MRRRTLLAVAGAAPLAGAVAVAPAEAAPAARLESFQVQGSDVTVSLLPGPAATVLLYVARRFHYEIDTLRRGELVADRSGTVLDVRPEWYPPGARNGYLPHQLTVLQDILAECDGLVAWGGEAETPREGRFAIAVRPKDARLAALAARLDRDARSRGRRVGARTALPFEPARMDRAATARRRRT